MEVDFLFDTQLTLAVENLIRNSKHKLILISPFIDLDKRIIDALSDKKSKHDFELLVLFGKNDCDYLKSIKKDSLNFLMSFPNIEIRYNDRLHAKYYQNDFEYIMTSLNLYKYSSDNNIEVGIKCEYAAKGLLRKAFDAADSLINQSTDKLKEDVLGMKKDVNPIEEFKLIFDKSELMYKTMPTKADKEGLQGLMGYKKLDGRIVKENKFESFSEKNNPRLKETQYQNNSKKYESGFDAKTKSAKQLGIDLRIPAYEITNLMQQKGFINGNNITEKGASKGLLIKNYMGSNYIAYPVNLDEFKELKK